MLVQQVQFDQLIDQRQVIRRELGSFFKCLARFVISLRLAIGQTERDLELWIFGASLACSSRTTAASSNRSSEPYARGQDQCGVS